MLNKFLTCYFYVDLETNGFFFHLETHAQLKFEILKLKQENGSCIGFVRL